jgi:hypothetical protein
MWGLAYPLFAFSSFLFSENHRGEGQEDEADRLYNDGSASTVF